MTCALGDGGGAVSGVTDHRLPLPACAACGQQFYQLSFAPTRDP